MGILNKVPQIIEGPRPKIAEVVLPVPVCMYVCM